MPGSILTPPVLSGIGPSVRSLIAWSRTRLTADGRGTRTVLPPYWEPVPVAVLLAEVGDVQAGGVEDPQPSSSSRQASAKSYRFGYWRTAVAALPRWEVGQP